MDWAADACFIGLIALVMMSICLRPLQIAAPWADEVACWLFIWTIYLAAATALKRNLHVRIDMLILRFSERQREGFLFLLNIPCLLFCLGLLYGIYQMMQASAHMSSPVMGIPTLFYYLPMFIGFAMMSIYLGIFIVDYIWHAQARGGNQ
jgi:TRAP-type C4-dicarboxylate transport system permease small subunit